jgi:hypothetical protein
LITSLIVAFVAYTGAFGIRLSGVDLQPASYNHNLPYALLDDDAGRGR